jgi:hypothetical protein
VPRCVSVIKAYGNLSKRIWIVHFFLCLMSILDAYVIVWLMQCVGLATPGPHFYFILKKIVSISPNRAFDLFFVLNLFFWWFWIVLMCCQKWKKHYFDSFPSEKHFDKQLLPQTLIPVHKKKAFEMFFKKMVSVVFFIKESLWNVWNSPYFFKQILNNTLVSRGGTSEDWNWSPGCFKWKCGHGQIRRDVPGKQGKVLEYPWSLQFRSLCQGQVGWDPVISSG